MTHHMTKISAFLSWAPHNEKLKSPKKCKKFNDRLKSKNCDNLNASNRHTRATSGCTSLITISSVKNFNRTILRPIPNLLNDIRGIARKAVVEVRQISKTEFGSRQEWSYSALVFHDVLEGQETSRNVCKGAADRTYVLVTHLANRPVSQ